MTNLTNDPLLEPPPEYETSPDIRLLTPYAQRQMLLGRFLDDAELRDNQLAAAAAQRAKSIDELRRVSVAIANEEQAEDAARPAALRANNGSGAGWSIQNRAKTELTTEVATAFILSKGAARMLIEESATLVADLPLTLEALETGAIRYEHARVIASSAWSLPESVRSDFERDVLPWAKSLILSAFRAKLIAVRESLHTTSMQERHQAAAAFRAVTLEPGEDGIGFLTLRDSNETLAAIFNRLTDIALAKTKDDPRTLAQRRVDVATEILLKGDLCASVDDRAAGTSDGAGIEPGTDTGTRTGNRAASDDGTATDSRGRRLGHGIVAHVHVTIPVLTLLGLDSEPATLDGRIPIDPVTARRLVGDAPGFYRLLTDPITGSIVAFDDKFRYLPTSLRRAVQLVDGTCTGPWCDAAANESEGHHPDEWARSHDTSLANSALVCKPDHQLIHNTRWSMVKLANGDKQWISPCGRIRRVAPFKRLSPAFVEAMRPEGNVAHDEVDHDAAIGSTNGGWPSTSNPQTELPF